MKLLSRKRYEELMAELETYEHRVFDLGKRLDKKQQELMNERRVKETLQEASETISNEKLKLLNKVKQLKDNLRKANGAIGGQKKENKKLKNRIEEISADREMIKESNMKLSKTLRLLEEDKTKLHGELNQVNIEKSKLQTSVIQLNEKNKVLSSKKKVKDYLRREERKEK